MQLKRQNVKFALAALLLVIIAPYQNCGGGFEAFKNEDSLASSAISRAFLPAKSSGLRPLTIREYTSSVKLLLGDTSNIAYQLLPEDTFTPFDNAVENNDISAARVQGFESAAKAIAADFLANSARVKAYLPCVPTGPSDNACFGNIVDKLGLKAFRRPLSVEEKTAFQSVISTYATKSGTYQGGLSIFLNVLLQHPLFLYRWEMGTSTTGTKGPYLLNDFELASRMSFTLFGLPPDDTLLADAAAGRLTKSESYKEIVERMIGDSRMLDNIDFFHASWLGYQGMSPSTDLSKAMRSETRALIKKVVLDENRPWTDIFTSRETYLTRQLANHYGIPAPASDNVWVQYPDKKRGGILSHGTFLSVGAKFGDTSPTQRGYHIRKQLFCEHISPPPPGIDVDMPPMDEANPSPCKEANYYASTLRPGTSCIGCHSRMDTLGFGLEQFSSAGQFRASQPQLPECKIDGNGTASPYGDFNGPGELGEVVVRSNRVESCMIERWMQMTYGIQELQDKESLKSKYLSIYKRNNRFLDLVREFVLDSDFKFRNDLEILK